MFDSEKRERQPSKQQVSLPDGFWLVAIWQVFQIRWRLILSCMGFGLAAAVALAFLMTPVYEVKLVMVPSSNERPVGALGGLLSGIGAASALGVSLQVGGEKSEAIAIIKSRAFTERFIAEQGLMPVLFAGDWDLEKEDWKADIHPTLYDGYVVFDTGIRRISENLTDGTVTLSILWKDPNQAAEWANKLVEGLNETMRRGAIEEARTNLNYLNKELQKTNIVPVEQAIYALIEENVRAIAMANVRKEYAFRVIDPAAPPNEGAFIKPRRFLILLIGASMGFLCGFFIAFAVTRIQAASIESR